MTGRSWGGLGTREVEKAIAALLTRVRPGAYAVDGAGGDDGADVVYPAQGGSHVVQIKSFASRLSPSQKRQIRKSLIRARDARPDMVAWTLALPLDPSPSEERWFNVDLAGLVEVPVFWMGLTQIEAEFAAHPHIAREFWPGSAERRALEMLGTYNQEQAALKGGVSDAMERGQKLRELLGLIDPDFEFDLELREGETIVGLRPRDVGSLDRNPIRGTVSFSAPPGSPGFASVADFLTYGVSLDLPAESAHATLHGLPGGIDRILKESVQTRVRISQVKGEPTRGRLVALGSGTVDRLAVNVLEVSAGIGGGARLVLADDAGVLRIEMWIHPDSTGDTSITLSTAGASPEDALVAASFSIALLDSSSARLEISGKPSLQIRIRGGDPDARASIDGLLGYVKAWSRLQDACGASIVLPEGVADGDAVLLEFLDELIRNGRVSYPWPGGQFMMPADVVEGIVDRFLPRVSGTSNIGGPLTFTVAGRELTLPGTMSMHLSQALVTNARALAEALPGARLANIALPVEVVADGLTECVFLLGPADSAPAN